MTERGSETLLEQLHGAVADGLVQEIKNYQDSGEPIPASLLAQAIKFLKDNGIDSPGRENNKIDLLAEEMDGVDFEDDTVVRIPSR